VARFGIEQLKTTPYLQLGKLFSIDRSEMESLRTLERLLTNYRNDRKATKPLSIAAFGQPGSGKSFGVKQLANSLFDDSVLLEFNLSQFTDAAALHGLFHQIRDAVLYGKLPIVFWDEFDSRELYWLQYLLAPMQDGTFQEGQITHPIGKCIFVFAGGTRYRFEDFGDPPATMTDERERQTWKDDFAAKKGPDFKSRLAGYINVLGPNRNDSVAVDLTYPVRRALLLRVQLGLKPSEALNIDHGLLEAFLRIEKYYHGARSLEKIAEQVRHSSRHGIFTRSDVPPAQQLALHVDAQQFLTIMETI
jgi:ATPase family associated with various cellular activities (AAA)